MNNQQIHEMLGIDAGAAEATRAACECLGLSVETAVMAIKCGLETGGVSRADDGNWLIVDIGLYQWVEAMETRGTAVMDMLNTIWSNPSPAANEAGGADFERLLKLAQDKNLRDMLPKGALIEAWRRWDPKNGEVYDDFVHKLAQDEAGGATGRDAIIGNRDMPQLAMMGETAVNGGGAW